MVIVATMIVRLLFGTRQIQRRRMTTGPNGVSTRVGGAQSRLGRLFTSDGALGSNRRALFAIATYPRVEAPPLAAI